MLKFVKIYGYTLYNHGKQGRGWGEEKRTGFMKMNSYTIKFPFPDEHTKSNMNFSFLSLALCRPPVGYNV